MSYTRKTKDYWDILGCYNGCWEVVAAEETLKEARAQLKCYRENEPGTSFRMKKCREPISNN